MCFCHTAVKKAVISKLSLIVFLKAETHTVYDFVGFSQDYGRHPLPVSSGYCYKEVQKNELGVDNDSNSGPP